MKLVNLTDRTLKRKRDLKRPDAASDRVAEHDSHSSRIDRHIDTHVVKETLFNGLIQLLRSHGEFEMLPGTAEFASVGSIRGHDDIK